MKKVLSTIILLLSVYLKAQVNLDSGLTACYPLNGQVLDMINGYNGTAYNVYKVYNRNAEANKALRCQGTLSSFIELPGSFSTKPNAISFSSWIAPGTSFGQAPVYVLYTRNQTASPTNDTEAYALMLENVTGGRKLKLIKSNGVQTYSLNNTTVLTNGLWYHICFSIDSASMSIYVDGILEASIQAPLNLSYGSAKKVYIGTSAEMNIERPSDIRIDNLKFYNRVISPAEVLQLFQNDPGCHLASQAPVASFSISVACVGQQIQVTDSSSNYPESWYWTTSGATITNSLLPNPTFTINSAGTQTLTLITANEIGSDTISKVFVVHPSPVLTVVVTPSYVVLGEPVTITVSGADTYAWLGGNTFGHTTQYQMVFTSPGNNGFNIVGKDSLGCKSSKNTGVYVNIAHSVEENAPTESTVRVFPNPTTGGLIIENFQNRKLFYALKDVKGATILEGIIEKSEGIINLNEQPVGIYFLQLKLGDKIITKKIVRSN
ncbi:MAG: T9SS type A sorting domain-containing protein [Bacteroidia bacterium]|nr:T9SS type A sorting domain-containing protein [Bacteroidia bacterium]